MSDLRSTILGACPPRFENPACRGHTDLFVATPKRTADELAAVLAICRTCPHIEPCREWALEHPRQAWPMYYGGLSLGDQRRIRRARQLARKPPDHGTDNGYRQHRRLGTQPCDECRQAHARAAQDRKRLEQ